MRFTKKKVFNCNEKQPYFFKNQLQVRVLTMRVRADFYDLCGIYHIPKMFSLFRLSRKFFTFSQNSDDEREKKICFGISLRLVGHATLLIWKLKSKSHFSLFILFPLIRLKKQYILDLTLLLLYNQYETILKPFLTNIGVRSNPRPLVVIQVLLFIRPMNINLC